MEKNWAEMSLKFLLIISFIFIISKSWKQIELHINVKQAMDDGRDFDLNFT